MPVHSFHIPVMGIGYTIDTPVRVAQYGISSVVSLVDDLLMEKMRGFYCAEFDMPFVAIGKDDLDCRAKRITAYLNTLDTIVQEKFCALKESAFGVGSEIVKYLEMALDSSEIKQTYENLKKATSSEKIGELQKWIRDHLVRGFIDVNIMTKLDKGNYRDGELLPIEYNDAHAALRGYANSALDSGLVLSAGVNQRLYSYIAEFKDFYPDETGHIRKRIILKVSDYRSALIQGKMLAKKGIWISEYRIESGLNCGGHAFPTQGHLIGPILEEFAQKRAELVAAVHPICMKALAKRELPVFDQPLPVQITVQGGVGTAEEHAFLQCWYGVDSVGWGSPFLLVPSVSNVDKETLDLLVNAQEDDFYLSGISPLGVPFNNLRGNSNDREQEKRILAGRPGSPCTKEHLALNTEFGERALCMSSRRYQALKLAEIAQSDMSDDEKQRATADVVEKACICVGLGTAALINNNLDHVIEGDTISICPGPAVVSFDRTYTLEEMVDHIYGRTDLLSACDRPHVFMRELQMYVDDLVKAVVAADLTDEKRVAFLKEYQANLLSGIDYYESLFPKIDTFPEAIREKSLETCSLLRQKVIMLEL